MRWWQVRHHLKGLQRRSRELWETTRWQTLLIAKFLGVKADGGELTLTDLVTLPWDDADFSRAVVSDKWEENIEKLRQKIENGEIK